MKRKIIYSILFTTLFLSSGSLRGATDFSDLYTAHDRYYYIIEPRTRTSLSYHSFSTDGYGVQKSEKLKDRRIYYPLSDEGSIMYSPAEIFMTYNSSIARGYNDGALWQGRGVNLISRVGIQYRNSFVSVRLAPEVWGAENKKFNIIETEYSSGYGDYWTPFDNLQRYGDDPYYAFSPGNSDIRFYFLEKFTLGISTENVTLGPGRINNIILSNNAEGFPHIDFGTSGAIPFFHLGTIDVRVLFGMLTESKYFDDDSSNDRGWISGFSGAWSPSFFKNFTFGFNYFYDKPMSSWEGKDLIRFFPGLDTSNPPNDEKDMMISLTFEWIFPAAGFTAYGEWGRNDNYGGKTDLWSEPEHTQAITLGFSQRLFTLHSNRYIILSGEHSNLRQERTTERRPAGPWYRHAYGGWAQGHTNRGQLLGAGIGPGSSSQWMELATVDSRGTHAFRIQRISHDKDYFYTLVNAAIDENQELFGDLYAGGGPYTELYLSLSSLYTAGFWDLYGEIGYSRLSHYNFEHGNIRHNIHIETGVRYNY